MLLVSLIMSKKETSNTGQDPRIVLVGKKIRELRKEKGYTSHENFAWEHDLPRVQYFRMEKGQNFRFESLLKILDAMEISLKDFFSDFEE